MSLTALVYVSTAHGTLTAGQLETILDHSRRNNERDGITGMLLYADGSFIQAIEGPEAAIDGLFARLLEDRRHEGVTVVARYPIARRQFPDWSMGFRRFARPEAADLAGALANLDNPVFDPGAAGHSSIAHKLLEGFRRTNIA